MVVCTLFTLKMLSNKQFCYQYQLINHMKEPLDYIHQFYARFYAHFKNSLFRISAEAGRVVHSV